MTAEEKWGKLRVRLRHQHKLVVGFGLHIYDSIGRAGNEGWASGIDYALQQMDYLDAPHVPDDDE
jgi:hypothetical protein